jgi:uncharacterized protein (TIGR00369 family)
MKSPKTTSENRHATAQHGATAVVPTDGRANGLSRQLHPNCVVCSATNPRGLGQAFSLRSDDSIIADFELDDTCAGYQGRPHGGVTSALLDASMGHWLFAHGLAGVTAELNVRFRHPIQLGEPARAIAELKRASPPLYILEARVVQHGQVKARATGKFVHKPELVEPMEEEGDG